MIDEEQFRGVFRHLAAGVTIVTTKLEAEYFGLTVTAFTSVSLDPPLVSVALDLKSRTNEALNQTGFFCANILASDQADLARAFTIKGINRFDGLSVQEQQTGAPIIQGSVAAIECSVIDKVSAGDHLIYIGEAIDGFFDPLKSPLIYYDGEYHSIRKEETQ